MDDAYKEVYFHEYCKKCKHFLQGCRFYRQPEQIITKIL